MTVACQSGHAEIGMVALHASWELSSGAEMHATGMMVVADPYLWKTGAPVSHIGSH